jgi:ParB family chromosome partitioning protein
MHILLSQIVPNPEQPRQAFDVGKLQELAESIKANGVIVAVTVEDTGEGYYILHDGERRVMAARLAGLEAIPATITPSLNGTGTQQRLLRALVANDQRSDLNPIEQAMAYQRLVGMGMTKEQVAKRIGRSDNYVSGRLYLLQLDKEIQELIAAGLLPTDNKAVRALLTMPAEARIKLASRIARPGLGINAVVKACETLKEKLEQAKPQVISSSPALTFVDARSDDRPTPWSTIRAAAQGMCDQCDANPRSPAVPEPAWSLIVEQTEATCKACSLRAHAIKNDLSICKQCPAVELLKRLVVAK